MGNVGRQFGNESKQVGNIDAEDVESITVLQKGAAVAKWGDKGSNGAIVINTKEAGASKSVPEANEDSIYDRVTHNAKYPGGDVEFYKFLSENVRYPKLCQEFGVTGRVIVNFVVNKDGSITDLKKLRCPGKVLSQVDVVSYKKDNPDATELPKEGQDLGDLLYEEAVRILKLMPKWEPAKDKDGNVVRSRFVVPIVFNLK